jgi:hypothetical protein
MPERFTMIAPRLWLASSAFPPGEVSKRAGNSADVFLRRYAGCLDWKPEIVNRRIELAMSGELSAGRDPRPVPYFLPQKSRQAIGNV